MTKVYLVWSEEPYEPSILISIHYSREKAEQEAKDCKKLEIYDDVTYTVKENYIEQ